MATTERFFKKQPHKLETKSTLFNPSLKLEIEVFGYNHKNVADDLYDALLTSGFFKEHPCFLVRAETADGCNVK